MAPKDELRTPWDTGAEPTKQTYDEQCLLWSERLRRSRSAKPSKLLRTGLGPRSFLPSHLSLSLSPSLLMLWTGLGPQSCPFSSLSLSRGQGRASCAARRPGKRVRDAALPRVRDAATAWWDSGTASRAPMPASRQPTASRFLGSVVRGFVPLLQLTRRPLRDILLQPCAQRPLLLCWGASGRAGRC